MEEDTDYMLKQVRMQDWKKIEDFFIKFDDLMEFIRDKYEDEYNGWIGEWLEFDGDRLEPVYNARELLSTLLPEDEKVQVRKSELERLRSLENRVKELESGSKRIK